MQPNSDPTYDGSAWAAILAVAIGCATFSSMVDLAESSKDFSGLLILYKPTGDLSGKSTLAIAVWLIAWAILHILWSRKNVSSPGKIAGISIGLIVAALVMTFPPFFTLFG